MPTKGKSAASSRRSVASKHGAAGRRLIAAAREALAHAQGRKALASYTVRVPTPPRGEACQAAARQPAESIALLIFRVTNAKGRGSLRGPFI